MTMFKLIKVCLHSMDIGDVVVPINEDNNETEEYWTQQCRLAAIETMKALGFEDVLEYMNLYPGKYGYNSEMALVLGLQKRLLSPETRWGLMDDPKIFVAGLCYTTNINEIIQECQISLITSRNMGGKLGSMTLFPKLKDFKEYADKDNPENRLDQLWFCLDWR